MEGFISTTAKKDIELLMMLSDNVIFEIVVPDNPRDNSTDFGFMSVK